MSPPEAPVAPLSGGERRRVALCRLLISNPDVLLLDEPTNHLDAESVAWLETYLKNFRGTLIVVTHDRYFLSNVTEWILELDSGRTYPYKGNYEAWLEQKQAAMMREAKQAESRRKLIENELSWVRTNPSGRRAKNQARVRRYEELASQEVSTREDDLRIQIPAGPRLGDLVVKADKVSMGFGDNLLFEGMSFDLPRGGIVGVIGGNGAGKTTLFKLITGQLQPLSGTLTVGPTVALSYVDQLRDALDAAHSVYEEITGGSEFVNLAGTTQMNGRAYCSRFNFKGADQQKRVGTLSGGERNRVHLAKLLRSGGNLLLLDEPSNDLDVATLRSLEEGISGFGGCVMVVSHDRWFLDRIATHILAFEGDSKVTWFEGNYADYHEHRRKLLGDAADRPTRVRFRPLKHG
jgi:ATP-binding cassette ChvD family protein